jgi:hypothetical protein
MHLDILVWQELPRLKSRSRLVGWVPKGPVRLDRSQLRLSFCLGSRRVEGWPWQGRGKGCGVVDVSTFDLNNSCSHSPNTL